MFGMKGKRPLGSSPEVWVQGFGLRGKCFCRGYIISTRGHLICAKVVGLAYAG